VGGSVASREADICRLPRIWYIRANQKRRGGISAFQSKSPECGFLAISEGGIEAHNLVNRER
jgi:hypothetical protein